MEAAMNNPTIETLARRLDKVERENRRLKQAGVVALTVIAAVVLMGQATGSKVAKVVEAEQFVVLDASGKTRVQLGVTTTGRAVLFLRDQEEKLRVQLVAAAGEQAQIRYGGSNLHLVDVFGAHAELSVFDRTPVLSLLDTSGKTRVRLGVEPHSAVEPGTGRVKLDLFDKAGKVIWSAP